MASSRETLKKFFQKEFRWNIIYLLGSGGLIGAIFLLYYYYHKNKQLRLEYQQKPTLPSDSKEAGMEEQFVHTTVAEATGNQTKCGNLNNYAIGPYPKNAAIDNNVENGDLFNFATQSAGLMDKTRLQNSLPSTDLQRQATFASTQNTAEESLEKYFSISTFQSLTASERKILPLWVSSSGNILEGGGNLNNLAVNNFGFIKVNAPLISNERTSCPSLSSSASQLDLSTLLRDYYQCHNQLENVLTGIPLSLKENHYVQLAMVKQEEQKEKEKQLHRDKNETNFRDERVGTYEKIHGIKNPIELEDLFKLDKDCKEEPKRLLVLGRAGIGKSTLCQYIVWCWSEEKGLWNDRFDAIFWIKLRDLENYHGKDDREEILSWFIHKIWQRDRDKELNEKQIAAWLKIHKGRVLFLLDGFDEVAHLNEEQRSTSAGKALYTLLTEEYVIITSRPNYVNTFWSGTQKIIDRCVENIGFSNEQIEKYIQHFFSAHKLKGEGKKLLIWLKQNPSIWETAHVPINISFICSIWYQDIQKNSDEIKRIAYLRTMTGLYGTMVNALLDRYLKKTITSGILAELSEDTKIKKKEKVIVFLSQLGFTAMQQETRSIIIQAKTMNAVFKEVFEEEQAKGLGEKKENMREEVLSNMEDKLDRDEFFKHIHLAGFLTSMSKDIHLENSQKDSYFLHLTFQEYFAAKYLAHGFAQDPKSTLYKEAVTCLKQHKFDPSYEVVWWFTAGLVQEWSQNNVRNNAVDAFWQELMNASRDLIGFKELALFSHLLTEAESDQPNPLQQQWWKALQTYLTKNNIDINRSKEESLYNIILKKILFHALETQTLAVFYNFFLFHIKTGDVAFKIMGADFLNIIFNKLNEARQEGIISVLFDLLKNKEICFSIKEKIANFFKTIIPTVNEVQRLSIISFSIGLLQNKQLDISTRKIAADFLIDFFTKIEKTQQGKIILVLFDLLNEKEAGFYTRKCIGNFLNSIFEKIDEAEQWEMISVLFYLLHNAKSDDWKRMIEANFLNSLFSKMSKIQKEKFFFISLDILKNQAKSHFSKMKAANFLEALFPTLDDLQEEKMILVLFNLLQNTKGEDLLEIISANFLYIFFHKMGKVQQKKMLFYLFDLLQNKKVDNLIKERIATYLTPFFSEIKEVQQEKIFFVSIISLEDEKMSSSTKEKAVNVIEILFSEMEETEQGKIFSIVINLLQNKEISVFLKEKAASILEILFPIMGKVQKEKIFPILIDLLEDKKEASNFIKEKVVNLLKSLPLQWEMIFSTTVALLQDEEASDFTKEKVAYLLISFLPIVNKSQQEKIFSIAIALLQDEKITNVDFEKEKAAYLLTLLFPIINEVQQEKLISLSLDLLPDAKMELQKQKAAAIAVSFLEFIFPRIQKAQQERIILVSFELLKNKNLIGFEMLQKNLFNLNKMRKEVDSLWAQSTLNKNNSIHH